MFATELDLQEYVRDNAPMSSNESVLFDSPFVRKVLPGWFAHYGVHRSAIGLRACDVFEGGKPPTPLRRYVDGFYPDVYGGSGPLSGAGLVLVGEGSSEVAAHVLWVVTALGVLTRTVSHLASPFSWVSPRRLTDAAFNDREEFSRIITKPFLVVDGLVSSEAEDRVLSDALSRRSTSALPTFHSCQRSGSPDLYALSGPLLDRDSLVVECPRTPRQGARSSRLVDLSRETA